jgi:hypothetical protein
MSRQSQKNRVNLTLSSEMMKDLQDWVAQSGETIALTSLCGWLIKRSLDSAIESGEFKRRDAQSTDDELGNRAVAYIQAVANSGSIGILELQKLADELNIPSDKLAKILKQAKGEITNGNHR